tara:strand:- start:232 stop:948 length:717 start_codon:yes stop_codon:yes gene_type:complete
MRGITDDFKNQQQRAMGILTRSGRGKGKGNKDSDQLLFKYPFNYQLEEQEQVSRIMKKLDAALKPKPKPSVESENESESKSENENENVPIQQTPIQEIKDQIVIRASDSDRLDPGKYLNDSIIDLWLRFISSNNNNSTCHFFTSHFYTRLEEEGPENVRSWPRATIYPQSSVKWRPRSSSTRRRTVARRRKLFNKRRRRNRRNRRRRRRLWSWRMMWPQARRRLGSSQTAYTAIRWVG